MIATDPAAPKVHSLWAVGLTVADYWQAWQDRPADCVCIRTGYPGDGQHTAQVDDSINQTELRLMMDGEACPVERRALERIMLRRRYEPAHQGDAFAPGSVGAVLVERAAELNKGR